MRDAINEAVKAAMRAKDAPRLGTLRLMVSALKDREIALRGEGKELTEPDMLALFGKMVKQRQESAKVYEQGHRADLADKERAEIGVIEEFLPRQMGADEVAAAIEAAVVETGAASMKDMGRVMAALKARYTGQMDFGSVGAAIKARLG